jgi:Tfp pilus assembly protein PilV
MAVHKIRHPHRRAFSLAELLVALTVLIPIMLVLLGVFPFAYGMNQKAGELIEMQEIARDRVERLRATPFGDLASSTENLILGNTPVRVTVTVTDFPAGQTTVRQKKADVALDWSNGRGAQHFELSTLLYKWAE